MDTVLSSEGKYRKDGNPQSIGEPGQARVGKCRTVEERDKGTVVLSRALVDGNVDNFSSAQSAEDTLGPLVGEDGGTSAESQAVVKDEMVNCRGLDRPDERVDRDRRVDADPPHDQLPVANVAGKDDCSLSGLQLCNNMFKPGPPIFEQLPDLVVGKDC